MDKRTIIFIVVAACVAVVLVAVWVGQGQNGKSGTTPSGPVSPSLGTAAQPTSSATRAAAPANVAVPNQGDKSAPTDVAVPQVQAPASQTSGSQYRSFNITVRDGVYSPATVAVNSGDVVDLEISAVGAAYGFTQPDYGFNASIPAGATQRIQFQAANAGKFTFYCAACGGPSKGPVGYLIVK